jgi:Na+-translocating ferredoxin:NAD+ oxidoreductase subunit G
MSPAWPLYRTLVGVGLLCGGLIVTVYELTRPVIARNQSEALQAAVFRVLPGAESSRGFRFIEGRGFLPADGGPTLVYAGYDRSGRLVGVAVEAAGMGYQDTIRLLYGYAPDERAIVGVQVLESKETPGLGDKIEKDEGFLRNFERLSATVEQPITAVKQGEKTEDWQIDGITGATISSAAVAKILNDSVSVWAPRILGRLDDFHQEARP